MIFEYDSSFDEAVDVQIRYMEKLKVLTKLKIQGLVIGAVLLFAGFYFGIPDTKTVKLIFATGTSIFYALYYLWTYKGNLRKRLKKILIEQSEPNKSIKCKYENTDEFLIYTNLDIELKIPWNSITEVVEGKDDFTIYFGKKAISVFPYRAFENDEEKSTWLNLANEKLKQFQSE